MQSFAFEHVTIGERGRGLCHHESSADVRGVAGGLDSPRDLDLEVGALAHGHVNGLRLLQLGEQNVQSGLVLSTQPKLNMKKLSLVLDKLLILIILRVANILPINNRTS